MVRRHLQVFRPVAIIRQRCVSQRRHEHSRSHYVRTSSSGRSRTAGWRGVHDWCRPSTPPIAGRGRFLDELDLQRDFFGITASGPENGPLTAALESLPRDTWNRRGSPGVHTAVVVPDRIYATLHARGLVSAINPFRIWRGQNFARAHRYGVHGSGVGGDTATATFTGEFTDCLLPESRAGPGDSRWRDLSTLSLTRLCQARDQGRFSRRMGLRHLPPAWHRSATRRGGAFASVTSGGHQQRRNLAVGLVKQKRSAGTAGAHWRIHAQHDCPKPLWYAQRSGLQGWRSTASYEAGTEHAGDPDRAARRWPESSASGKSLAGRDRPGASMGTLNFYPSASKTKRRSRTVHWREYRHCLDQPGRWVDFRQHSGLVPSRAFAG